MSKRLTVGLLAGEASGDNLGAGLMTAMRAELAPDFEIDFVGVGGARMIDAGLDCLFPIEKLSVNGFRDPILKLPTLIKALKSVGDEMLKRSVDLFIGVDFNVFNFLLEGRLKKRGLRTAHYVSPSVYAWRRGRTKRVAKVADVILCLFPFEPPFYEKTSVQAVFVGHPLADEISLTSGDSSSRAEARKKLGLTTTNTVVAVLPGSRTGELKLMLPPFLEAATIVAKQDPKVEFLIPYPRETLKPILETSLAEFSQLSVKLVPGGARTVLQASDVALVKSGTSTLEAMLLHRPMVVSYRMGKISYQLAKRLMRSPYVALPNILLDEMYVPELLQHEGTPEKLAHALLNELQSARQDPDYFLAFERLHKHLRRRADVTAARAVIRLLGVGSS
ncbi:MAG: lipid-A-disaccharide synthase [Pseudomonadales bacterium]|nr:lipid-A-disaccharide synthase [Pseudomonadales bacterium]